MNQINKVRLWIQVPSSGPVEWRRSRRRGSDAIGSSLARWLGSSFCFAFKALKLRAMHVHDGLTEATWATPGRRKGDLENITAASFCGYQPGTTWHFLPLLIRCWERDSTEFDDAAERPTLSPSIPLVHTVFSETFIYILIILLRRCSSHMHIFDRLCTSAPRLL